MEGGAVGHNIERGLPKDHPSQICLNLVSAMIASFIILKIMQFWFLAVSMSRLTNILGFSVKFFFQPIIQIRHILIKDHI
jgi:hypothetical protein